MIPKSRFFTGALFIHLLLSASQACEKIPQRSCDLTQVLAVQTISAPYRLTAEPALIEMAKAVRALGSDTLKVSVSPKYSELYHIQQNPRIKSIRDLVASEATFKAVLDMPFRHVMLWVYPFSDSLQQLHEGKISQKQSDLIYREIYDFTSYLLTTYSGTGKSFYLGNWEGDWHTVKGYDQATDPSPETLANMREWFLLREKAVSDARRDTSHHGVKVFFYVEINHVKKAMKEGRPAIVNRVLPHIKTDFVSYSSYDVTKAAMKAGGEMGRRQFFEALDYIEKHLPPSDIPGKRVMIGEYGVTLESVLDPAIQAKQVAQLMFWALEWGCPFVIYWQLYCNEINPQTQKHRGYWLIDDHGVKQPTWHLHHDFLQQSRLWTDAFLKQHARSPSQSEFNKAAREWLADRI
ncbi:MAG: hypothetical protein ACOVRB_05990 [Akkermansiaceae bacterium]